jgi:hypothetical protein
VASGKVTAWWGIDYILLEKINNKWMIRMVLWQGPIATIKMYDMRKTCWFIYLLVYRFTARANCTGPFIESC